MKIFINPRKKLALIKKQLLEHYINDNLIDEEGLIEAIKTITKSYYKLWIRWLVEEGWLILNITETISKRKNVYHIKPKNCLKMVK